MEMYICSDDIYINMFMILLLTFYNN